MWTEKELDLFRDAQTLQNRPLNDDLATFEEDNPVWEVVVNDKLYIRAAKAEKTKWYQAGTKNGGHVRVQGHEFAVKYVPVKDEATIKDVTAAYKQKYNGQYPIDLMVSDQVAHATVELDKVK